MLLNFSFVSKSHLILNHNSEKVLFAKISPGECFRTESSKETISKRFTVIWPQMEVQKMYIPIFSGFCTCIVVIETDLSPLAAHTQRCYLLNKPVFADLLKCSWKSGR